MHIIEARELKAENADGTSDPIVYVECFGQKQNTTVVNWVSSVLSIAYCIVEGVVIYDLLMCLIVPASGALAKAIPFHCYMILLT